MYKQWLYYTYYSLSFCPNLAVTASHSVHCQCHLPLFYPFSLPPTPFHLARLWQHQIVHTAIFTLYSRFYTFRYPSLHLHNVHCHFYIPLYYPFCYPSSHLPWLRQHQKMCTVSVTHHLNYPFCYPSFYLPWLWQHQVVYTAIFTLPLYNPFFYPYFT